MKSVNQTVSVVIPNRNYGRFLGECIESVLSQTLRAREIVVVDNGSTDSSREVAARYEASVRLIPAEGVGVSSARNTGVAATSGEYIAFLDADDVWYPEKLEKQIAVFQSDPEIGLVHCGMREFDDETGKTIKIHLEGGEGRVAKEIALWERPVIIGPGGSIMVSRTAFEDAGGFDERLTNGEDWEFCFRIASAYKVGFVREVLVEYRNHGGNAHRDVEAMERSTRIAWAKVFSVDHPEVADLRRRSYANLHKVLAGSFLVGGSRIGFLRNLVKSLWYRPGLVAVYLKQAFRRSR